MENLGQSHVAYVNADADLKSVLSCFKSNNISHIPVVIEKKVVGMISKTDVVEYLNDHFDQFQTSSFSEALSTITAKQVMIQPLVKALDSDSEQSIIDQFSQAGISSVVIVNSQGQLKGIVTDKDLLQYLLNKQASSLSLSEELSLNMVQWLDEHGIIRASKVLSDFGI